MDSERVFRALFILSFLLAWSGMILDVWMDGSFWMIMVGATPATVASRIVFTGLVSVFFLALIFFTWIAFKQEAQ